MCIEEYSFWKERSLVNGAYLVKSDNNSSNKQIYYTDISTLLKESRNLSVQELKKSIKEIYGVPVPKIKKHLYKMIYEHGKVYTDPVPIFDWKDAFKYAQEWNRYSKYKEDKTVMSRWIERGKAEVSSGLIRLNEETWEWLATLGYLQSSPKESANHYFLKGLLELYFRNFLKLNSIEREKVETIFSEQIRYDLYFKNNEKIIVGELGGVQLWKVMTALEKGFTVYVLPHWTINKKSPFSKVKREFQYFKFTKGGSMSGTLQTT